MNAHRKIDWDEVRSRLQAQQTEFERGEARSPEQLAQMFRERAAALAARGMATVEKNDRWPALVFRVGDQRYCCALSSLVEVLPLGHSTPVPGGPPELLGVMNVRGEIRPVLDLARILKVNAAAERSGAYVLLARHAGREAGLAVDGIEKIENVSPEELTALEGEGEAAGPRGRHRTASRAIVLLIEEILAPVIQHPEGR